MYVRQMYSGENLKSSSVLWLKCSQEISNCPRSCQPRELHRVPSAADLSSLKRPRQMNAGGRCMKLGIGPTCNETRLRRQRKLRSDSSRDSENFLNNTNIVLRDEELRQR